LDEAMNELTLLTTGIYGQPLPRQHGAPLRLIVPWKYGYKSPKSIVKIDFTAERPRTFWNDLGPTEYSFLSNVDPDVPHPRWSQMTERDIGTGMRIGGRRIPSIATRASVSANPGSKDSLPFTSTNTSLGVCAITRLTFSKAW